jgi:hypothetical protein
MYLQTLGDVFVVGLALNSCSFLVALLVCDWHMYLLS